MDYLNVLEDVGMTRTEAKVYLALISTGSGTIGPIIKKANLNNSVAYYAIERLISKGFVRYTQVGKKRIFEATEPERLLQKVKETEDKVKDILPSLEMLKATETTKNSVYIYSGLDGIIEVFNSTLKDFKPGDEELVIGASRSSMPLYDFLKRWNRRRERMGIKKKITLFEDATEFIGEYKKMRLTKTKLLPKSLGSPLAIDIHGNKTILILWGDYPIAVMVDNQKITEGFKRYFKIIWKTAKWA